MRRQLTNSAESAPNGKSWLKSIMSLLPSPCRAAVLSAACRLDPIDLETELGILFFRQDKILKGICTVKNKLFFWFCRKLRFAASRKV
jgi:hypothetical protein